MAIGLVKGNTVVAVEDEGTKASGTIQIILNPGAGEIVTVNGATFTEGVDWTAGGTIALSTDALAAAIAASNKIEVSGIVDAVSDAVDTVTITAVKSGTDGNAITLAESTSGTNFTLSGATLASGASNEGTAAEPSAGASFIQILEDGLELAPAKELVERGILTSSIGKVTPRVSTKSVSGSIPVEFKASGSEGSFPEYGPLLNAALGTCRRRQSQVTTGTGHSTTVINITDADDFFQKNDFVVVLESGAHHASFVSSVSSTAITLAVAADSAFTDNVVIAKCSTYLPANDKQPTFTKSVYWGGEDGTKEQAIGSRVTSLALENFTTGQIPSLNFSHEGLSFNEVDVTSLPFTPSYDTGLPPLALSVKLFQDAECLDLNEFSFSLENTAGFLTSVKSADGRISSRFSERSLTGSLNPYKDDTSVAQFTRFNTNASFSLHVVAYNESSTAGEYELGSVIGIYLPQCILTEKVVADQEGILVENLSFSANRGESGTLDELAIGFC